MIAAGVITGSGFYELAGACPHTEHMETEYGPADVGIVSLAGKTIGHISRHGPRHERLPNQINHRANIAALAQLGAAYLIGTTVCGITNPALELGKLLLFTDLFFPENRLPAGDICTFFTHEGQKGRGHHLFASPFVPEIVEELRSREAYAELTYGQVNGPRFNSRAEIAWIRNHCDAISQTCGPEVVLAGELEIPYILLGYGVDYANGIKATATPVEVLRQHLEHSPAVFREAILRILEGPVQPAFKGFLYRFG